MQFKPGDHVVEQVDDALHGLLSAVEEQYVRAHAAECPICAVALRQGEQRLALLRGVPTPEASQALIAEVVGHVMESRTARMEMSRYSAGQRAVRRWTLRAVAAAIVIMGLVNIWFMVQKPSAYDLRLLGQQQMLAGAPASLRAQLTRDNVPVEGATIRLALYDAKTARTVQLASYTTDAAGTGAPMFTLPDWPDGSYTLRATATSGFHTESLEQGLTLKRESKVMLSTDKPVYQPGQTIHMRALALRRPDFKPVTAAEAVFSLTDPRGNVIFKQKGATSSFGITAADCPLAEEITQGTYTLVCRVGTTESSSAVEIKRYAMPKFKVMVTTDKPFYAPGERVRATVQADYFFGQHVAGAEVSLAAQSGAVGRKLADIAARTDAAGSATVEFVLPNGLAGTEQEGGDARVTLTATVRDSAEQEQARTVAVAVTTMPIHIELIPESGRLVEGLSNRIYVLATYADGRPAQARLDIAGIGGSAPLATSELGVAVFELTPHAETAELTVTAVDGQGVRSQRHVMLATLAADGGSATDDYLFRTDKAVYRAGETLNCEIAGGGNEPVFVDVIKDGQTMRTATVNVSGGRGSLPLDLSHELAGTLELNAYRYGVSGLALHKTRLVYVQAADDLRIQVGMDRATYRPGEPAHLSFHLTDAQGKPVAGALSLAAVDEAVYSVLESAPGWERTFFTLDQQLLKPVATAYPAGLNYWNIDTRQELLNQAVFSRAASAGAGRDEIIARLVREGRVSPRLLQSLNTEWGWRTFREQVEQSDLTAEQKAMLLSSGPFSLNANTGPANQVRAQRLVQQRRDLLPLIWGAVLLASVITLLGVFARDWLMTFIVVFFLTALLIAMLLPSLSKARMSARSATSLAEARALVQTVEMDPSSIFAPPNTHGESNPPRLRQYFPEMLLWRPELITDERGNASLELPLADSITTWRLSSSAVSAAGQLGGAESSIKVFQPFFVDLNLPAALTRGDEISVPAVVYNYLQQPQTVELALKKEAWFEALEGETRSVTLAPGEVKSVYFRIRAARAGTFNVQISARAGDAADAIERSIEVLPGGRRIDITSSGTLAGEAVSVPLNVPADAIEGSVRAQVKIYPTAFSQVVEGLDSIFQMPYGCFEQTSSTTYPNVLALDYLRATGKNSPVAEVKARQYIHLGYQRLLSFEIEGGGFDWFGHPPADRTLTAYGLMEFQDMARVHDIDPNLMTRTRKWLLAQQAGDGSWDPGQRFYHDDPTALGDARLATTAYIAWAAFEDQSGGREEAAAQRYLRGHAAEARQNPYTAALTALALLTMDPGDATARELVAGLEQARQQSSDGKMVHWSPAARMSTAFYGEGTSADVETTALAALAMLKGPGYAPTAHAALNWLVANKDSRGTWHSTQATVLALKALLAGTRNATGDNVERRLALDLGGVQEIRIAPDQSDVLRAVDITPRLGAGAAALRLLPRGGPEVAYQVTLSYNVPGAAPAVPTPLEISVAYGKTRLETGETVPVTATVRNHAAGSAAMVMVDLPVPAGFAAETASLEKLQGAGRVEKYQVTSRQIIVYLRGLEAGAAVELPYGLRALMPVKVQAPAAEVYEYYKPENRAATQGTGLEVVAR